MTESGFNMLVDSIFGADAPGLGEAERVAVRRTLEWVEGRAGELALVLDPSVLRPETVINAIKKALSEELNLSYADVIESRSRRTDLLISRYFCFEVFVELVPGPLRQTTEAFGGLYTRFTFLNSHHKLQDLLATDRTVRLKYYRFRSAVKKAVEQS